MPHKALCFALLFFLIKVCFSNFCYTEKWTQSSLCCSVGAHCPSNPNVSLHPPTSNSLLNVISFLSHLYSLIFVQLAFVHIDPSVSEVLLTHTWPTPAILWGRIQKSPPCLLWVLRLLLADFHLHLQWSLYQAISPTSSWRGKVAFYSFKKFPAPGSVTGI